MNILPFSRRRGGFSLVELLVSVAIGLLALMFATKIVVSGEQGKKSALGGSDAMQNGMLAMFSISSDISQAGFGINDAVMTGCDLQFLDANGYQMATATRAGLPIHPLAPAVIEANVDPTKSDTLSLYSGSSMAGTGMLGIAQYTGGNTISVDNVPFGFNQGDVIVAAVTRQTAPGSRCALSQITGDVATQAAPPVQQFLSVAGTARFSTGTLGVTAAELPASQSRVFNLGPAAGLSFHTWSVEDGFLKLRATNLAGSEARPSTVIDNVVAFKAQYGFDTRTAAQVLAGTRGMEIDSWSNTMIDADGLNGIGDNEDYERIAAVRIAVVARSKSVQKPDTSGNCDTTTVFPTVFTSASPQGVPAVPMMVSVIVPGDTLSWKCYRYRVFETIVPVRNSAWHP